MTQIGLGTVQIGLPYGNQAHQALMSFSEAQDIVLAACERGVKFIDTAKAYGESEVRLGQMQITKKYPSVEISTKIPRVDKNLWSSYDAYCTFIRQSCAESRQNLGLEKINLLQFHQCDVDFLESPNVGRAMQMLIDEGECANVGISVYELDQAQAALEIPAVSSLQIPLNIIDQRFIEPKLLEAYDKKSIRLIARSCFLQGVLLKDASIPKVRTHSELSELRKMFLTAIEKEDAIEITMRFLLNNLGKVLDTALIGVDVVASLHRNLDAAQRAKDSGRCVEIEKFSPVIQYAKATRIFNPLHWN